MLTYRTGIGDVPSAARFMADHLLEATIPGERMTQLAYYHGVALPPGSDLCSAETGDTIAPQAAAALGLAGTQSSLSHKEITNLLCGYRADGRRVLGKQYQRQGDSIASILNLPSDRLPDGNTLRSLADTLRDDRPQVENTAQRKAIRQLFDLYQIPADRPIDDALCAHLGMGVTGHGETINARKFLDAVTARRTRIGYIDLTWSADKSVSIAWALASTDAERAMILQAHRDAVSSAMGEIATLIGRARKGKAGAGGWESGHIAWIRFEHFTARPTLQIQQVDPSTGETVTRPMTLKVAGDPQLHTHVIVPNVVVTDTGRVCGLDLDRLKDRVKEYGAFYQAFLANNLRAIGVNVILDPLQGAARLPQVPDPIRDAFSKRTAGGQDAARAYAAAQGRDWDTLTPEQQVGLLKQGVQGDARQPKSDDMADFDSWQEMARAIGWNVPRFVQGRDARQTDRAENWLDHAHQIACERLTERFQKTAVIDGAEMRLCAAHALIATGIQTGADVDTVVRVMRNRPLVLDDQQTRLICVERKDRRGETWLKATTGLHVDRETDVVALAQAAAADRSGALDDAAIDAAVAATGLDFTSEHGQLQRQAMTALATQGRLSVLVGVAGSGKTTLLAPLVHAWQQSGRRVFGTAVAWRQAEELAGAGIPSDDRFACHGFLHRIAAGTIGLDQNAIVVLDELSLLSTVQLLALLQAQRDSGCRLVLIGDPKQCQAVDAGPVVDLLRRALGPDAIPELISSVRQQTDRERGTALMWRDGQAREALDRKTEDGTLIVAPGDYNKVVGRIADLWRERHHAGAALPGFSLTVSAPTNEDARAIASAIRAQRRGLSQLGPDLATIDAIDQHGTPYPMHLAAGDRVRLYARTNAKCDDGRRGIIGNNGSVLEVRDVTAEGLTVRAKSGRVGTIAWATLTHPDTRRILLGYGDVLSIDATQGVTSTEHIEAMPRGSRAVDAHRAYTQGSRHRETTWLVTSEAAERQQIAGRRAMGDSRPIRVWDILDNMGHNMTRADPREGALALLDQARRTRKTGRTVFQGTVLTAERTRQSTGSAASLQPAIKRHRERLVRASLESMLPEGTLEVWTANVSKAMPQPDLAEDIHQAVAHAVKPFGARLTAWLARRRRDVARANARARLRQQGRALWRRVERRLTAAEIPDWGTPEYFAAIGFDKPEQRRSIGIERARNQVDRLLRLAGRPAREHALPRSEIRDLVIDLRSSGGSDPAIVDDLEQDLNDMEITFTFPHGRSGRVVTLSREALVLGLANFNSETVEAVCDRLLLSGRSMDARSYDQFVEMSQANTHVQQDHHAYKTVHRNDRDRGGYEL